MANSPPPLSLSPVTADLKAAMTVQVAKGSSDWAWNYQARWIPNLSEAHKVGGEEGGGATH